MDVLKRPIGIDVLAAAQQRIAWVFDNFPRIYVSFSGGKDSSVMLHLVMDEAIKRGRKVGVLFVDLEAQYKLTIEHIEHMYALYKDHIEPYWCSLPIILRNAVSQYDPRWKCWDPEKKHLWVRTPPDMAITDPAHFPFFEEGMEFEEFVPRFGEWYAQGDLCACFVGIRSDESLNRFRTLMMDKRMMEDKRWTTWGGGYTYNIYPIYDWRTRDIWIYNQKTGNLYNHLYDLMHLAGLTPHQMRICQPYGDDQRKGLDLFHVIEPETWGKVVARVNGANTGALYCDESGNILGNRKISKPDGHTWQSYANLLLASLPERSYVQFKAKIDTFLSWYLTRGYEHGIPEEADPVQEASKKVPSWRRICKAILKNDYWCKTLSFAQTESDAYDRWKRESKIKKNAGRRGK